VPGVSFVLSLIDTWQVNQQCLFRFREEITQLFRLGTVGRYGIFPGKFRGIIRQGPDDNCFWFFPFKAVSIAAFVIKVSFPVFQFH
jgi:hypothetical protein